MTTPDFESKAEYMRRMSDDGLGNLASLPDVEDNISASFEELGNVVASEDTLPSSVSIRPNGAFSDASSLHEYLESGGLVVTDGAGNVEPIGFVWLLKEFDDILDQDMWQVYIDSDTG